MISALIDGSYHWSWQHGEISLYQTGAMTLTFRQNPRGLLCQKKRGKTTHLSIIQGLNDGRSPSAIDGDVIRHAEC